MKSACEEKASSPQPSPPEEEREKSSERSSSPTARSSSSPPCICLACLIEPFQGSGSTVLQPQGSSFLATLGWRTQSLWDWKALNTYSSFGGEGWGEEALYPAPHAG